MKTPAYLKQGDTVGIISTARKISESELAPAVQIIEKWGFKVQTGKHLFKSYHQFAGTDAERIEDLQQMLNTPSVKAVFCARGGYGTLRIIDKTDFSVFKKSPKWIIGYSDITVLHSHIHVHCKTETLHASMPVNFSGNEENVQAQETLRKVLNGEEIQYEIPAHPFNRSGAGEGMLLGGNLSLLYAMQNSVSDIDTDGKILFIEDIDEYLYHIDRMLISLKRAGKLNGLAALITGGMTDMKDNAVPFGKTAEEIIMEAVEEFDYPVCFGFPAGHIKNNMPIILGRKAQLTVSKNKITEVCYTANGNKLHIR